MPMRIENTAGVAAVSANPTNTQQATASTATAATAAVSTTPAIDPTTGEPKLPSFPWLSHMTVQLQQAAASAKAKPIEEGPFKQAEIAGTQLNKIA